MLSAIERSLLQYNIECVVKKKESKSRPKPILTIKGKNNLVRLCEEFVVVNGTPIASSHGKWYGFVSALEIVINRRHLTDSGFMEIVEGNK